MVQGQKGWDFLVKYSQLFSILYPQAWPVAPGAVDASPDISEEEEEGEEGEEEEAEGERDSQVFIDIDHDDDE